MTTKFHFGVKTRAMASLAAITMLVLTFMLGTTLFLQPASADAASLTTTPASGYTGTVFTISATGFKAGEKVNLVTTDPSSTTLGAGYMYADSNGNFTVKVNTTDPDGLAASAGTNYTTLMTDYDSSGTEVDQYLKVILFKPAVGAWSLAAQGSSSNTAQTYDFTITAGSAPTTTSTPTTSTSTSSPASGGLGTVFTLKAGGFLPGEKVALWTTDPNSKDLTAGYILADQSGNIKLEVYTSDPDALATGGNYSTLITIYDSNHNITDQYLEEVLSSPSTGSWYLTGQGATSGLSQIFNFTITG